MGEVGQDSDDSVSDNANYSEENGAQILRFGEDKEENEAQKADQRVQIMSFEDLDGEENTDK